jgi:hypothetical protein
LPRRRSPRSRRADFTPKLDSILLALSLPPQETGTAFGDNRHAIVYGPATAEPPGYGYTNSPAVKPNVRSFAERAIS